MYSISFNFKGQNIKFEDETIKLVVGGLIDFLHENGYKFEGTIHSAFTRKPVTLEEINNHSSSKYYLAQFRLFHKIKNSNKYIWIGGNVEPAASFAKKMLINFGIDESSINITGFTSSNIPGVGLSRIKKFGEIDTNEEDFDEDITMEEDSNKKYTFAEAAQIVLKQNDNKPMSAREIWNEIESQNLIETKGLTPWSSINSIMIRLSVNSKAKSKRDLEIFKIVEDNPYKFILLNPSGEVQNVPDEDEVEKIKLYKNNPFGGKRKSSAICVLGKSGSGKSVTIEKILENEDHEFQFIIPTAATTGLLAQFSPSKSGYVPSRLGRMLMSASKNPQTLYTAVFDEMHKSNVIEMINDELLQAISTKRNTDRFISLDDDTAEIYEDSDLETKRGNLLIPDNFGFIFISSKPKVITSNADFFNRVDIIQLESYEDELIETSEQLLSKILDKEEKSKLKDKRGED